jgi:Flp pilus assembly pilin Flp
MRKLLARCWNDDAGALIATEFLFTATVLVIGLVVGLTSLRNAINAELTDLANTILALNQSFVISGQTGCGGFTEGSAVINVPVLTPCPVNTIPTFPVTLGCDFPCP